MTCVIGFADKNKNIYMGADSASVGGLDIRTRKDEKVFIREVAESGRIGEMLIGYTSSWRMGQLLRFKLAVPKYTYNDDVLDVFKYMCTDFMDAVRECLVKNGYAVVKDNKERIGYFLVGYKGIIFDIQGDLHVGMMDGNFNVCGCGENYALASLETNKDRLQNDPEGVILEALRITAKFSSGVCEPFYILKLDGGK